MEPLVIRLDPDQQASVDQIARRYVQRGYTYGWALWLVSQEIGSTDRWTPIVVLAEATKRYI
jgi:hypothetical protein